jgi:hypothetical protein
MIWFAVSVYAAIGVVFGVVMLLGAMKRLDPLAAAAPFRVKALLFPGLVGLWPVVGLQLFKRKPGGAQ